jgi:hypothetical protein
MSQLYVWFTKECRKPAKRVGGVSFSDRVRAIELPPEALWRRVEAEADVDAADRMQDVLDERTDPQV